MLNDFRINNCYLDFNVLMKYMIIVYKIILVLNNIKFFLKCLIYF